jgi:pimeloyl-ACP methyl ester carboxylesterase
MDSLGLDRAALVGHSQAGAMAVELALTHPERIDRVVVLGTGSLLPPLPDQPGKTRGPIEGEEGSETEPAIDETRATLEANLYDHSLLTDAELALRHRMSTDKNFRAFLARNRAAAEKRATGDAGKPKQPLWQRLGEVRQPLLLIYGRDDRGHAGARAERAMQSSPSLNLHIVPNCKHLVQWDAAETFHRLAGSFLRGRDRRVGG